MQRPLNLRHGQQGAVLLTALIFLMILTMLAIASMDTNVLEVRMAANSQDINRAFQTAETGLQKVLFDDDAFSTTNVKEFDGVEGDTYAKPAEEVGVYEASVTYNSIYRQSTTPPRGSGWDSTMAYYHFDLSATATTPGGAVSSVHAGAYQVGKRQ